MDQNSLQSKQDEVIQHSRMFFQMLRELLREVFKSTAVAMVVAWVVAASAGEELPWWSLGMALYLGSMNVRVDLVSSMSDSNREMIRAVSNRQNSVIKAVNQAHQAHTLNGEMIQKMIGVTDGASVDAPPGLN